MRVRAAAPSEKRGDTGFSRRLVLTSRGGNRLLPSLIRVCDRLRPLHLVRACGVALLEVRRQLKIGQVIPVFCFCEQLPFVHAVVCGLLTAQRTHRTQALHLLHCEPPSRLLVYRRICVVTALQIELTSDSPVFDGQSMTAQSSDFSANSRAERRRHRRQQKTRRGKNP